MNKHKVGDIVNIKVANLDGRKKVVPSSYEDDFEMKSFEIIGLYYLHKEMEPYYMVIVEPDMIGWTVSKSHMFYYDLKEKFLNQKFYDVTSEYFN